MKKRILFMMLSMKCGGVEKALLNILDLLNEDEYDVTILFVTKGGEYLEYIPKWVHIEEVTISEDEKTTFFKGPRYAVKYYLRHGQILEAMKKFIRTITINRASSGWGKSAAYFESITNKISVIDEKYDIAFDFHGYTSFTTFYIAEKVNASKKASWIHSEFRQFDPKPFIKYYEKYNYIFGVSQKCVDEFVAFFPEFSGRTSVLHNIFSVNVIKDMSAKGEGFNDDFDGTRILTIGRLSKAKGYDIAIPVLARLIKDGYNVRWYAIGDGDEREKLESLIKQYNIGNSFVLLGFIANPYTYLSQCDIYVQPSRYEGYCTTIIEAKIFNRPIICTDVSGSREQLIDNETGLITDIGEDSIYSNIKKLLDNRNLCKSLVDNLAGQRIDNSNEKQKLFSLLNSTEG